MKMTRGIGLGGLTFSSTARVDEITHRTEMRG
jgi:hypothetical protein